VQALEWRVPFFLPQTAPRGVRLPMAAAFFSPLFAAFLGQQFEWADLAIIGLLVLLEGVLSIDNALVLGLLAKRLPKHLRGKALSYGIIGAFVFRAIAVLTAAYLLRWTFVKFIGGAYLVYIAVKHLFFEAHEEDEDMITVDAQGHPVIVDAQTGGPISAEQEKLEIKERVPLGSGIVEKQQTAAEKQAEWWHFWKTVGVIELTDIAFAVDSILAAIALAGGRQSKLWVIITGGILGMILMRFAAAIFIRLLDKFPRFELSAYLLVVVIGLKLLADWGFNSDWSFRKQPQIHERMNAAWQQRFDDVEAGRQKMIDDYDAWLKKNWIFHVQHRHPPVAAQPGAQLGPHVDHLLDFHDLRFPECMSFWLIMMLCFAFGFIPKKSKKHGSPKAQPAQSG
jgi:predicted tellurium resistance membrane protein TerC